MHAYARTGRLRGLIGSAVGHISTAPGFKPRPCYAKWCFIFLFASLPLEVGRSAHLTYLVHKSGRKRPATHSRARAPARNPLSYGPTISSYKYQISITRANPRYIPYYLGDRYKKNIPIFPQTDKQ